VIKTCYNNGQKERLCLIIDKCRRQKLCKRAQKISAAAPLRVMYKITVERCNGFLVTVPQIFDKVKSVTLWSAKKKRKRTIKGSSNNKTLNARLLMTPLSQSVLLWTLLFKGLQIESVLRVWIYIITNITASPHCDTSNY
jgi:hypothetical protein